MSDDTRRELRDLDNFIIQRVLEKLDELNKNLTQIKIDLIESKNDLDYLREIINKNKKEIEEMKKLYYELINSNEILKQNFNNFEQKNEAFLNELSSIESNTKNNSSTVNKMQENTVKVYLELTEIKKEIDKIKKTKEILILKKIFNFFIKIKDFLHVTSRSIKKFVIFIIAAMGVLVTVLEFTDYLDNIINLIKHTITL